MELLLVNPPTLHRGRALKELEPDRRTTPYYDLLKRVNREPWSLPGEHLGLQSIQASADAHGHTSYVLNACIEMHSTLTQTLNRIQDHKVGLVGFSGPLDVFSENLWLAQQLREAGYTGHITLGHDFATLNHSDILRLFPEFDSIVRGEGEITLSELATALDQNLDLTDISGITYRKGTKIVTNPPRPVIPTLDELPTVNREKLHSVLEVGLAPSIYTSRGCPYRCTFCTTGAVPDAEGIFGPARWRLRSPARVVDEVEFLSSEYGIRWVTMVDDLYLSKGRFGVRHALEIAHELLERQIDIEYMIDVRVDSIDEKTFALLRRSGLRKVFIGVESGSPLALASYGKGYHPEIIRKKLATLEDMDIDFILGYIFFSPLDTLEGLSQSLKLVVDLNVRDFSLFLQSVRVYPGTPLHHELARRGLLEGEFPFLSALYPNPFIERIRGIMGEFEYLVWLRTIGSEDNRQRTTVRKDDLVYELAVRLLSGLIDCGQREDIMEMDRLFSDIKTELLIV